MKKLLIVMLSCASIAIAQTDFVYGFKIQGLATKKQSAKKLQEILNDFQNRLEAVSAEHEDIATEIKINGKSVE